MPSQITSERAQHAIFQRHPLVERHLSFGQVTSPYHIYDGRIILIVGTADSAAVRNLLAAQHISPLQTQSGKTWMALWVCDFTEANLGAHQELQVSFFGTQQPEDPVSDDPLQLLKRISLDPGLQMLCYGLWNNTETVVAYNRELLHLDAHVASGTIQTAPQRKRTRFRFSDGLHNRVIIEGEITTAASQGWRESLAFLRSVGWSDAMKMAHMPYIRLKVVNPVNATTPQHLTAQTFTMSDKQGLRFFDPRIDSIRFGMAAYQGLGFDARLISYSTGVRFVYLEPQ